MQKISIDELAKQQLEAAVARNGRTSKTVVGGQGKLLRQTVIAMKAGTQLSEHSNPGEATLLVLQGSVRLRAGDDTSQGKTGDLLVVPEGLHSLEAEEDSSLLFSVARIDRRATH